MKMYVVFNGVSYYAGKKRVTRRSEMAKFYASPVSASYAASSLRHYYPGTQWYPMSLSVKTKNERKI